MASNLDERILHQILCQIMGPTPILYLLRPPETRTQKVGARFVVAPGRSQLPGGSPGFQALWDLLKRLPMPAGLTDASTLNLIVSRLSYQDQTHALLNSRLLTATRRSQLLQFAKEEFSQPDAFHVFNRVGILLLQRLILAISSPAEMKEQEPQQILGELALVVNDYIAGGLVRQGQQQDMDYVALLVEMLPTWEIANSPDLAHGLTRAYRLFQHYLLGNDPIVADLRSKLPLDFSNVRFDGLLIDEYVACIFGLYSWLDGIDIRKLIAGDASCVIDPSRFLGTTKFPQSLFNGFVQSRSRTTDEFRLLISKDTISDADNLSKKLSSDVFIADVVTFRQFPLCRIDETRLVCLDARFLSELLIYGLYWQILGVLEKPDGDIFLSLWGRLLELYLTEMLAFYYPSRFSPLRSDVEYEGGQIDALLDFGDDLIIFEFKGSLLKGAAKYDRDIQTFQREFRVKFIENDRGEPKALRQLVAASEAAAQGELDLAASPKRIFPVFVGYESCLDGFWMNRYADDLFKTFLKPDLRPRVRPLTVMSVQSFETALPYTSAGDISWADIFEPRFFGEDEKVVEFSVHQVIYDWRTAAGLDVKRNEFVLRDFEAIFEKALAKYKGTS